MPIAAAHRWREDGFVVLPAHLSAEDLAPALGEREVCFPTADGFHDGTDPRRHRFLRDEFAGIDTFPFASVELGLLAVHPRVAGLVEALLGTEDVRLYSAEAWAKYTGAARYDQRLHRDYLNHTVLVPTDDTAFQQVQLFLHLVDVPEELGPPHLVPAALTADLPVVPNWWPRTGGAGTGDAFDGVEGVPALYAAEVSAAGPAGTVVAFTPATVHRGTELTRPRGARFTTHLSYRPAAAEWGSATAGRTARTTRPGTTS